MVENLFRCSAVAGTSGGANTDDNGDRYSDRYSYQNVDANADRHTNQDIDANGDSDRYANERTIATMNIVRSVTRLVDLDDMPELTVNVDGYALVYNHASGKFALAPGILANLLPLVLRTRPANLLAYWPLSDASGGVAIDASGHRRSGAYTGPSFELAQQGIGDGRTSVSLTADAVNLYSSGLAAAFNPAAGTFMAWARVSGSGVWVDGTQRYVLAVYSSTGSTLRIYRNTTDNVLYACYNAAGTVSEFYIGDRSDTAWMHLALTWDKTADQCIFYVNGSRIAQPATGLGTWGGTPLNNFTNLGALNATTFSNPWTGYLAHSALWNVALSGREIQNIHDTMRASTGIFALGDSKTVANTWIQLLCRDMTAALGMVVEERPYHYGISGAKAVDLATAVVAGLPDEWETPRYIPINVGANDVGAATPESVYRASLTIIINALRSKWPTANIYIARPWVRGGTTYCNAIAGWIDAVIATYSSGVFLGPDERTWLENGDDGSTYTSDGVHYNTAGQAECAAQWLAVMT